MSAVLSPIPHGPALSARGRFGEAVAALLQGRIQGHGPELALHLSAAPDLHALEHLQARHSRVVGAFLFERYAVITPLLEDASACASCFRRRFVSAPPPPYSVEFCESVIANSERDPQFEYEGFLSSTARLVAELVLKSLATPQTGATVIDQFGAQHQGAPLLAVHGCRCRRVSGRSQAGPDRFTRHLLGDLPWPSH